MNRRRLVLPILILATSVAFAEQRPPRTFDLLDVSWHIDITTKARTIVGDVTNTLKPLKDNTSEIWFDSGKLTIKSIEVNGKAAKFRQQGEYLYVTLPKVANASDTLKVRIQYSGSPEAGVYFIPAEHASPARTSVVYTQGEMVDTRYWIPTYDWPDDKASLESFITVPANQYALSNGKLLDAKVSGKKKTYHWKLSEPQSTYLMSFVAGEYSQGDESWDGIPIQYFVPVGLESAGKAAFGGTNKMVEFYSKLTGFRYPYPKFSQSAVPDFMFGGMENTTCVTQTISTLHPQSSEPVQNSAGLVAHELAHQWFGDTVTCKDWAHAWLNEGFATLLPTFWFRNAEGQDSFDMGRHDTFDAALGSQLGTQRPVVFSGYTEPINMFDGQIYPGGAARMFMLMHEIGEETFWKGITVYLNENKFKEVDTETFFAVMSRVSGKDLTPFMKMWLYGLTAPRLTVARDGTNIRITQVEPLATMMTSVAFLKDGKLTRVPVEIKDKETIVDASGFPGAAVLLDPDVDYMCQITDQTNPSSEDLAALYQLVNAGEKMRLLDTVAGKLTSAAYAELCKKQQNPLVLERMINRIAADQTDYLLTLANSQDKRIENTAVDTLGNRPKTDAVVRRLTEIFQTEANPALRNTALDALLKLTQDYALAEKAYAMNEFADSYRRTALRFFARHDADDARERCLLILEGPTSEQLRIDAINHLGGIKDKAGDRRVYNALVKIAQEPSFGARQSAINALASYGDKAAIPIIEPATHHSLHYMRNTAIGAIERLKQAK